MLNFYRLPPVGGAKPGHVVIFLHGLGDSGRGGLLSIGNLWGPALPDTEFICPDAPFVLDNMPESGGRQWFALREFTLPEMFAGVQAASPYLNDFIDKILETRGITADKLALVGFSQGTMMALYVAPRREKQIAGVVGYSGVLIGGESLPAQKKSAPPVLLIHGDKDDVVPDYLLPPSEKGLKAVGIPVNAMVIPGLAHNIDNTGMAEGLKFLKTVLI